MDLHTSLVRAKRLACALPLLTLPLAGQPWISAVANSASYAISGQNGYGIAPGSLFVVFGYYLGPDKLQQTQGYPLPTTLAGTSVRITMGGQSWDAIMVYTLAQQIAAVLPSRVPTGSGFITVTYNKQTSPQAPITVVPSAFGTYSVSSNGVGAGIVTRPDYQLASFASPFTPGDVLIIWGTGLGAVTGDEAGGPLPGNVFPGTEVFVGGQPASVQYAGRSGCCAGMDQIVFQVPATAPLGCFVPVSIRSGAVVSNFTTIPIGTHDRACSDPVGVSSDIVARLAAGQAVNVGVAAVGPIPILQSVGFSFTQGLADRFSRMLHANVTEQQVKRIITARGSARTRLLKAEMKRYATILNGRQMDVRAAIRLARSFNDNGAAAGFTRLAGLDGLTSQFGSILPPAGTCTVTNASSFNSRWPGVTTSARDAGTQMVLTGPVGTRILTRISNGEYQADLGSGFASGQLPAGTYTITTDGGTDVGPFTTPLVSGQLQWTNGDAVAAVDRSQPFTVTWSGTGLTGYVLFGGASSDGLVRTAFACVEEARKQTLTVPSFILSSMPAATANHGYLFLTMHPFQNPFTAAGIDAGYFADFSVSWRQIPYQ